MICTELGINKPNYQRAQNEPFDFIYVDKPKKRVAKNLNENIQSNIYVYELFKWIIKLQKLNFWPR